MNITEQVAVIRDELSQADQNPAYATGFMIIALGRLTDIIAEMDERNGRAYAAFSDLLDRIERSTEGGYVSFYRSENGETARAFRSLAGLVYTECPCGCGSKEICEAHAARVKAHDDAIPF